MSLSTAFVVTPECMSGATRSRKSSSATEVETRRAHDLALLSRRFSAGLRLPFPPRFEHYLSAPVSASGFSDSWVSASHVVGSEGCGGADPSRSPPSQHLGDSVVKVPGVCLAAGAPSRSSCNQLTPDSESCQPFPGEISKAPCLPWWEDSEPLGHRVCERAPTGRASPPDSVRSVLSCSCHYSTTPSGTCATQERTIQRIGQAPFTHSCSMAPPKASPRAAASYSSLDMTS